MPFKVPKLRFLPSFGTDIGSTVTGRSKLAESGARSVFSFLPGFIATPPRPFDTVRRKNNYFSPVSFALALTFAYSRAVQECIDLDEGSLTHQDDFANDKLVSELDDGSVFVMVVNMYFENSYVHRFHIGYVFLSRGAVFSLGEMKARPSRLPIRFLAFCQDVFKNESSIDGDNNNIDHDPRFTRPTSEEL
jgi:hypothetical protein